MRSSMQERDTQHIADKPDEQPCETCSKLTLRSLLDAQVSISFCNCSVGEFIRSGVDSGWGSLKARWNTTPRAGTCPLEEEPILLSLTEPFDSSLRHGQLQVQLGLDSLRFLKLKSFGKPSSSLKFKSFGEPLSSTLLDVSADASRPAATVITRRVIHSPTSCQTVTLIREWLKTCDKCHEWCCRDVAGSPRPALPPLPTRVVDLGHEDQPPRLLVTNGERGKYVALSHRWPSEPSLLTRKSNLADLQAEIPLHKLSETFADVFSFTRRLGIRYIWIDCLCIIQDDLDDWQQEAEKMGTFYEMAYFTIAATAATFGCESLTWERKPRKHNRGTLELPCDPASPAEGTFFLTTDSRPNPEYSIGESALNRRGWVLQERLLSRRVVHFASDQIYWECREHAVSQSGTVFRPQSTVNFLFPLPGLMKNMRAIPKNNIARRDEADCGFMQAWLTIMEYYSACQFTYEMDRLPALLGLVDRLSPLALRTYIEGNWFREGSKELPVSLLWTACGGMKNRLPEKQRAASWSWASIEGEVTFQNLRHTIEAELVQILRPPPAEHSFTKLWVRGKMISAHVSREDAEAQGRVFPLVLRKRQRRHNHTDKKGAQRSIGNITLDLATHKVPEVECLYMLTDFTGYPMFLGLEKVTQSVEGLPTYRRVGFGSLLQGWSAAFKDSKDIVLV